MTAEIVSFPTRQDVLPRPQPCAAGDLVVVCVNATLGLWAAWPVALVDDDGVVLAVRSPPGKVLCVHRLACDPTMFGLRAADHIDWAFRDLAHKTWRDCDSALLAFKAIEAGT